MNRLALLPLILLLLLPNALGQQPLQVQSIQGSGLAVSSTHAWAVMAPGGGGGGTALSINGSDVLVRLVDEAKAPAIRHPTSGHNLVVLTERHRESPGGRGPAYWALDGVTGADAKIIIVPASERFSLRADTSGPFEIVPVDGKVLESSHYNGKTIPPHPDYYEYVTGRTLEMNLTGPARMVIEGDFHVYLWAVHGALQTHESVYDIITGYSGVETAPGVWHENFTYAIMSVFNGVLTQRTDSAPVQLYSNQFDALPADEIELEAGAGVLPSSDGSYDITGDVAVQGGQYEWTRTEAGIGVRVLNSANAVIGQAIFVPTPWTERPWFPFALGFGVVGIAVASAWVAPSIAGHNAVALGNPPRDWKERRAHGYFRWALAADSRSAPRRAAFWTTLATRASPRNPDLLLELGIFLRLSGKPIQALATHGRAHELYAGLPGETMAHNAYEAAKAAVQANQIEVAVDWLRQAVELEPGLADHAQGDAEFARLRLHPDFLSLTGPSRMGGPVQA